MITLAQKYIMSVDFNEMAEYYDAMYVDHTGYENECNQVVELVSKHGKSGGNTLLDIACGTGEQAKILARHFIQARTDDHFVPRNGIRFGPGIVGL